MSEAVSIEGGEIRSSGVAEYREIRFFASE
jgi:hypothetical protein